MKAELTLNLRTREVSKLFERRINSNTLFVEAILHKINKIIAKANKQDLLALKALSDIEQELTLLTQKFTSESKRLGDLISKMKEFKDKKINFVVQFHPTIEVTNPINLKLAELISGYDELIATIKLLRLAGCFDSDESYFLNIKQYQKMANRVLSGILISNIK
ncbi:TPA: hypothetical protein ACGWTM_002976 [Legionella pneumophila]